MQLKRFSELGLAAFSSYLDRLKSDPSSPPLSDWLADPQTWHVMLYRNYPRDRHYQFFSARIPRSSMRTQGARFSICRAK